MIDKRVNTRTKRIREINNILDNLDENDSMLQSMEANGSSLLVNLISPDGSDFSTRTKAIDCANQIHYSLKELESLDSSYHISNTGSEAYSWLKLEKINLLEYVPDCVKEITGTNGVKYDPEIIDFHNCFAPLRKWIKPVLNEKGEYSQRGMNLQSNKEFGYPNEENIKANEDPKKEIDKINIQIKAIEKEADTYENKLERINKEKEDYEIKLERLDPKEDPQGYLANHYREMIRNLSKEKEDCISSLSDLYSKARDLENKKSKIKLLPEIKYGYYYDDYYLLQRNIQKLKITPLRIVTGTSVHKGAWGKITTENTYETITKDVIENERETKCDPLLPSPLDFKDFVEKDEYSNKPCLVKSINSLKYIDKLHDEYIPEEAYYNKLIASENSLINDKGKEIQINDSPISGEEAYSLLESIPGYFYYQINDNSFMLAKVIKKEMYKTDLLIKDHYKPYYSKATDLVKYCIYDEKDYNRFYKNNKYNVKISLELDYSNITDKDLDLKPKNLIGDENYIKICNNYKDIILKDLSKSFDIYKASPVRNSCVDGDPDETYPQYISYLTELPLINNTQCNMFIDYCIDTIFPWVNDRIKALEDTMTDVDNAETLCTLLLKRLRKNSGSLLIWYQSIIQFDNTYINNLLTEKLIKDSTKYMLVTKGYDGNSEELFNNHLYCDYIDILDINEIYGETKFNVGDEIYIINGIKEQKNKIKSIDKVEIEVASETEPGKTVKENVIRLKLEKKLLKWCYTNNPSNILISKLL